MLKADMTFHSRLPVSRGGLLRYDNISTQSLPSRWSYALLEDDYFDRDKHPDGLAESTVQRKDGSTWTRKRVNSDIVKRCPHDTSVDVVIDRLRIFLPKSHVTARHTINATFQQEYYLNTQDPKLSAHLVYLDGASFSNGQPARDVHGNWRPGVHEWAKVDKTLDPQGFRDAGFPTLYNVDGEEEFVVTASVLVPYDADRDMRIGWKIVDPAGGENTVWEDTEVM